MSQSQPSRREILKPIELLALAAAGNHIASTKPEKAGGNDRRHRKHAENAKATCIVSRALAAVPMTVTATFAGG